MRLWRVYKKTASSGDNFVQSKPELGSDLVDMEGYGVVKVCKHLNKPVELIKYGTDFADENSPTEWQDNMSKGKELFLDWLKKDS
jgi:nucleoside phosphorylase